MSIDFRLDGWDNSLEGVYHVDKFCVIGGYVLFLLDIDSVLEVGVVSEEF
jgi:hypothetical protein